MQSMRTAAKKFSFSDSGTSATEYAILLALVVLAVVGAISGAGTKVAGSITTLDSGISGVL